MILQIRLKKEQEEKEHKKKEKAEAHLYTIIKVWLVISLSCTSYFSWCTPFSSALFAINK